MLDTLSPQTTNGGRRASADYGNLLFCRGCKRPVTQPRVCPVCVEVSCARCLRRATHQGIRGETLDMRLGCQRCVKDASAAGPIGAEPDLREED